MYTAKNIRGPWARVSDINPVRNLTEYDTKSCQLLCHSAAATGAVRCNRTIHGQLNSIGQLQTQGGDLVVLAMIDRCMTAPGANPLQNASNCDARSRARNTTYTPGYVHGHDAQY